MKMHFATIQIEKDKLFELHSLKVATGEKEPRPGALTHSLHPKAELAAIFQLQIAVYIGCRLRVQVPSRGSFSPVATFKLCS